jgi:DNA gyrase subunit B/topoisomerase-4 subunit B
MFPAKPVKLNDCHQHGLGSDSELFIVEGDSASKNVVRVRDKRAQAVLPMQGKPLNAWKASREIVARNDLYQKLIVALGTGWDETFDIANLRYDRIILLFDPDADGIHCGALTLMFFLRWMPDLVDADRIQMVRPPLYEISSRQFPAAGNDDRIHAYSDDHFRRLREHLRSKRIEFQSQRFRGLASINADSLVQTCVDRATRNASPVGREDAEAAVRIFGGESSRY